MADPGYEAGARAAQFIGRVWPAWPTYARVSVGTRDEMAKFKTSLVKVMSSLQV
jgi:hypothetical protein